MGGWRRVRDVEIGVRGEDSEGGLRGALFHFVRGKQMVGSEWQRMHGGWEMMRSGFLESSRDHIAFFLG